MPATAKILTRDDFSFGVGSFVRTGPRRFEEVTDVITDTDRWVTVELAGGDQISFEYGTKVTWRP